jgi:hypothetical protein
MEKVKTTRQTAGGVECYPSRYWPAPFDGAADLGFRRCSCCEQLYHMGVS